MESLVKTVKETLLTREPVPNLKTTLVHTGPAGVNGVPGALPVARQHAPRAEHATDVAPTTVMDPPKYLTLSNTHSQPSRLTVTQQHKNAAHIIHQTVALNSVIRRMPVLMSELYYRSSHVT